MQPVIVLLGGYNSVWTAYLRAARHLEDISGLRAIGVPLLPWDWWQADRQQNAGPILVKLWDTVLWARRRLGAKQFILVAHSAGGLASRLYLSDQPVGGETYAGAGHVSTLIMLGSPHCAGAGPDWYLAREANRIAPGATFANRLHYYAVAGQSVQGNAQGTLAERRAFRSYRYFSGKGEQMGDGVIPIDAAHLPGAENRILDNVVHSRKHGANWYLGSKAIIRQWWPQDVSDLSHE